MKIIAADDERLALNLLVSSIEQAQPDAELKAFLYQSELVAAIDGGFAPDVAFLDIEMPGMSGIELAKRIKEASPKTSVVFVTGYPDYALEAYRIHARGFVTKPATAEKIREELDNLSSAHATEPEIHIRVQCFGEFEVFADDAPVTFSRSKSKELLAYLVDRRGATCSSEKQADILWDDGVYDRSRQKQLSTIRREMLTSLKKVGAERMVSGSNDSMVVCPNEFCCDYYKALAGDAAAINCFMGEYMASYSWAELTTATLMTRFCIN